MCMVNRLWIFPSGLSQSDSKASGIRDERDLFRWVDGGDLRLSSGFLFHVEQFGRILRSGGVILAVVNLKSTATPNQFSL